MSRQEFFCPPYTPMWKVIQPARMGEFVIEHFELTQEKVVFEQVLRPGIYTRFLEPGRYVRLAKGGEIMMTDTGYERFSNLAVVKAAHGNVLIAGLGIGMILLPILNKPDVESVVVVEKERDVCNLVLPQLQEYLDFAVFRKLHVEVADIFAYRTEMTWDTVYFDIWNTIDGAHYQQMKKLRYRYGRRINRPNGFLEAWSRDECRQLAQ